MSDKNPAPTIRVTPAAKQAIEAALVDMPDDRIRLEIDARFANDLSLGPPVDGDIVAESNGVLVHFDPESAKRAEGLVLDYVHHASGPGFKIDNPNAPAKVEQCTARELKTWMDEGRPFEMFDVRTTWERDLARIERSRLLDAEGQEFLLGLDRNTVLVFQCHHGIRSQSAAAQFVAQGFKRVFNLAGGIDAWSREVDPSVPKY